MAIRYSLQDTDSATATRAVPIAKRYVPPRYPRMPGAAVAAFEPSPILIDPLLQSAKDELLKLIKKRPPFIAPTAPPPAGPVTSAPVTMDARTFNKTVNRIAKKRAEGYQRTGFDPAEAIEAARRRRLVSNPLADVLRKRGEVTRPITASEWNQLVNRGAVRPQPNALGWAQGWRWKERMPNTLDRRPLLREGATAESAPAPGTAEYNASPFVPASVAQSAAASYFADVDQGPTVEAASQPDPVGGGLMLALIAGALFLL